MKYLLDTHTWIWSASAPERLSTHARRTLASAEVELMLSAACIWEIAIKYSIGRLELPTAPVSFVSEHSARLGVVSIPIEPSHALHVATLPMHHRDPFDRLLVAQAQLLGATIVTADADIARYDVAVLDPR